MFAWPIIQYEKLIQTHKNISEDILYIIVVKKMQKTVKKCIYMLYIFYQISLSLKGN